MALAAPAASFPANCCSQSGGAGAHLAHLPRAFREIIMFVAVPAAVGKHAQPAQRAFDQARGARKIHVRAGASRASQRSKIRYRGHEVVCSFMPAQHKLRRASLPSGKHSNPPGNKTYASVTAALRRCPALRRHPGERSEEGSLLAFLRALQIFSAVLRVNVPVFELAITLGSPR